MTFLEKRITREAEHAGRVARQNALDAGKTREQAAIDEHLTVADVYALLVRRLEKVGEGEVGDSLWPSKPRGRPTRARIARVRG